MIEKLILWLARDIIRGQNNDIAKQAKEIHRLKSLSESQKRMIEGLQEELRLARDALLEAEKNDYRDPVTKRFAKRPE